MAEQLGLLLPTPAAPRKGRFPIEPIIRTAEIEGDYRWSLKRAWGPGPCILWCGLNPSTADGTKDDPTMLREIGFSYRWGFGSLIKVNIYPFRSSTTDKLHEWRKGIDIEDSAKQWPMFRTASAAYWTNMDIVTDLIEEDTVCVAAWGNGVDPRELKEFLEGAQRIVDGVEDAIWHLGIDIDWQCLGINKDGSPVHTLARGKHRVPDDAVLRPWVRP